MKRNLIIGVVAFAVLIGVFLANREEPKKKVTTRYSIEALEGLSRARVSVPAAKEGEEAMTYVLEKKDGGWFVTAPFPLEHPLDETKAKTLDDTFSKVLKADDIKLSDADAADLGLAEGKGAKLELFAGAGETPAVTLMLGEMTVIERTRATRTYVRDLADGSLRRVQANLKPLTDDRADYWRERKIVAANKTKLDTIKVTPFDSTPFTLSVVEPATTARLNPTLSLSDPVDVGWELEQEAMQGLANTLGNMEASGFVDGADPKALGLEPPQYTVRTQAGEEAVLRASHVDGKFYVQLEGRPQVYEVTKFHGERLTRPLSAYRSLSVFGADKDALTSIAFAGPEKVVIEKKGDAWAFVSPETKKALDEVSLGSTRTAVANLKAQRWVVGDELVKAREVLAKGPLETFTMSAGETTWVLHLGPLDPETREHFARVGDAEDAPVVSLSKYSARRVSPGVDILTGGAPPKGP